VRWLIDIVVALCVVALLVWGSHALKRAGVPGPSLTASLGPQVPGSDLIGKFLPKPKSSPSDQLAVYTEKLKRPPANSGPDQAVALAPAPLIFCAEIQQRVTQADCDDYVAQARSARAGLGAFNAPNPMTRDQTTTLELAVSFKPPAPGASTPEEVVSGLPGKVVPIAPTVGRHMAAELSGEGFTVTPSGLQQRDVEPGSVTTWDWTVRADRKGDHVLILKTVVEAAKADGGWIPLASTTKNQTIHVTVDKADAVRDVLDGIPDWLKSIQAIVVALAALLGAVILLVRRWRKLKGAKAKPGKPKPGPPKGKGS
jgi:hypothetical protein